MERCLPRYLRTSLIVILTGFGFLWFGMQSTSEESKPSGESFRLPSSGPSEVFQPVASASASENVIGIEGERAFVSKVVDGDTIEIDNNRTVRFIGIDTPETVDPRRPVGCFGKEASNETKRLLSGKRVILQKDISDEDKYNRILRYIYLPLENGQILFVNDYLIREGFAKVLTYPPDVKFDAEFREAESLAKQNKKGLWGRCN